MSSINDFLTFYGNYASPVTNSNPLITSLYVINSSEGGNTPPPSSKFIITQSGLNITTLSGDKFITDN